MKIRPVEAEFDAGSWTDEQTNMTKLIVAFSKLRTRLKIAYLFELKVAGTAYDAIG
jgi:hypothetical protein